MKELIQIRPKFKFSAAVFIMLLNQDSVLLQLRSNTGWFDNHYSLPSGIKEEKEPLNVAAVREAYEELGVRIDPADVALVHMMHNLTTGEEWIGAFFAVTKWKRRPKIKEPHKHSEIKWVPLNDLPSNVSPYVKQALQCYLAGAPFSLFGWEVPANSNEDDYKTYYSEKMYQQPDQS